MTAVNRAPCASISTSPASSARAAASPVLSVPPEGPASGRASQASSACQLRLGAGTALDCRHSAHHAQPTCLGRTVSRSLECPGDDTWEGPARAPHSPTPGRVGRLAPPGRLRGDGRAGHQRLADRRRRRWRRLPACHPAHRARGARGRGVLDGCRGIRVGLLAERAGPVRGGQGAARARQQRRRRADRARGHAASSGASARPPPGRPPRRSPRTRTRRSPCTPWRSSASTRPSCPLRSWPRGRRWSPSPSARSSRCCPSRSGSTRSGWPSCLSALASIVGGGLVARLTGRPFWRGALRQLMLGGLAAGLTYLIGLAVGGMAS